MLYILLGPTGVGKTTLGKAAAAALPNCKLYEMERLVASNAKMPTADDVVRVQGPDHYWRLCARILQAIDEKHKDGSLALCAVGSLALRSAMARSPLAKSATTLLIWGKPEEVYNRSGWWPDKPLQAFLAAEYGIYSKAVYEKLRQANCFDTTGLGKDAACKAFAAWLQDLMAKPAVAPPKAGDEEG